MNANFEIKAKKLVSCRSIFVDVKSSVCAHLQSNGFGVVDSTDHGDTFSLFSYENDEQNENRTTYFQTIDEEEETEK